MKRHASARLSAFEKRLFWVSIAPLERPVVPEVYRIAARSSGLRGTVAKATSALCAASVKLPKRLPYHVAMDLLLTGRWFDAQEAHGWGIVNHIHPAADLMTQAREMAALIASGPPLVYAAIKEVVRDAEDSKFQDTMNRITQRKLRTVDILYGSEDQKEGALAFAEKRDPVWKGR